MLNKKCWLREIQTIYEDEKHSQIDISWTSSDSENESKSNKKYTNTNLDWVKPATKPITEKNNESSPEVSPIISSFSIQEMSPILTENTDTEIPESSPVIGKRHLLKKMRKKFQNSCKRKKNLFQLSPDIFDSQSTQQTIENDLLDSSTSSIEISTLKSIEIKDISPLKSMQSIYPFPSQFSSQITKCDSSESYNSNSLYHQPIARRKRFKNKGVASQLQKVLNLQKTRISMWKHEVFMKRSSELVEVIEFTVLKIKNEYGHLVVECIEIAKDINVESKNFFLILISGNDNPTFVELFKYKLYSPYESKIVLYKSKDILCHYNVTKIIKS